MSASLCGYSVILILGMSSILLNGPDSLLPYIVYLLKETQSSVGACQEMVTIESVKFIQARKIFGGDSTPKDFKVKRINDIINICLKRLVLISYNGIILQKLR